MKHVIKKLVILNLIVVVLSGCANSIDFKNDKDRKSFTTYEIEAVQEKIASLDGVESFKITDLDGGVYAVLIVEDRKKAKELATEAFVSMWRETTGFVDLFVKESGKEDVLIQVFKPAGTDSDNVWHVMI